MIYVLYDVGLCILCIFMLHFYFCNKYNVSIPNCKKKQQESTELSTLMYNNGQIHMVE